MLVRKKSGELRMCVDYRGLNARTVKDAYPLPRIDDLLDALGGAAIFSTMDLQSAYYQVEIAEEDKAKTAFTTPIGLFEFNRMAFGLCNAPATYQRLMQDDIFNVHSCTLTTSRCIREQWKSTSSGSNSSSAGNFTSRD